MDRLLDQVPSRQVLHRAYQCVDAGCFARGRQQARLRLTFRLHVVFIAIVCKFPFAIF